MSRPVLATGIMAVALATVLVPAPARADVTSHQGKASIDDSSPSKVVILTCPAGLTLLGGGAQVHDGAGEVHLTGWMPIPPEPGLKYPNSMVAYAAEAEAGYAGAWQVGVSSLCGPAPAGLAYLTGASTTSSATTRSATAVCPRGTSVVGTGARIAGGDGQVYLTGVAVAADLSGVAATAHEDATGFAGAWSLFAYAICADPLPDHEVVWFDSASDPSDEKEIEAPCPDGTELHGTGAVITGAAGHVRLTRVGVLDDWVGDVANAVEADPVRDDWSVRAYAVCASD